MKIGLTLGKFAPLHRGHQHVIETALSEVDHLIVLIYDCPELSTTPLPIRAGWIRKLYPTVEVMEAWGAPTETGLDPEITARHDNYLRDRLQHRRITHFYSSEPYGEHVSKALGCEDRQVDLERSLVPISATAVRADTFQNRHFLAPIVYHDLITQVVFLGAPSTGKSTISEELAKRHQTTWMPEYGREYWEANQQARRLTTSQLVEIAEEHRRREERLILDANRYFFIDTDASTTLQFSYYYHQRADERLIRLADEARARYDLFFLCDTDIPFDDTWDRSGEGSRQVMQRRIEADLLWRRVPYHRLHGNLESRCQQVNAVLDNFTKTHPRSNIE